MAVIHDFSKDNLSQFQGSFAHRNHVLMKICAYHPVTFLSDCLACELPCTQIQNLIGDQLETLIPKQLRDELFEYLYGENNPLIKIRELTGIALTLKLHQDDAKMNPESLSYLSKLTEDEWTKHWKIYFKGHFLSRALFEMSQAGFVINQLPEDIHAYVDYYKTHTMIMSKRIEPDAVLSRLRTDGLTGEGKELIFNDVSEATEVLLKRSLELVKKLKNGDVKDERITDATVSIIKELSHEVSSP